jgi:hypothetical protein
MPVYGGTMPKCICPEPGKSTGGDFNPSCPVHGQTGGREGEESYWICLGPILLVWIAEVWLVSAKGIEKHYVAVGSKGR